MIRIHAGDAGDYGDAYSSVCMQYIIRVDYFKCITKRFVQKETLPDLCLDCWSIKFVFFTDFTGAAFTTKTSLLIVCALLQKNNPFFTANKTTTSCSHKFDESCTPPICPTFATSCKASVHEPLRYECTRITYLQVQTASRAVVYCCHSYIPIDNQAKHTHITHTAVGVPDCETFSLVANGSRSSVMFRSWNL